MSVKFDKDSVEETIEVKSSRGKEENKTSQRETVGCDFFFFIYII